VYIVQYQTSFYIRLGGLVDKIVGLIFAAVALVELVSLTSEHELTRAAQGEAIGSPIPSASHA
jgi:hypothetical protein